MGEGEDKTEQPTPKRLRDAKKKGQVAYSKDFTSTVLLIGVFAYIGLKWWATVDELQEFLVLPIPFFDAPFRQGLSAIISACFAELVDLLLPVLGIVAAFAIAAGFVQVGAIFTTEPIKPDIKKLNPIEKFKQIFSKKNIFEFLKSVLKVTFLGILIYRLIKSQLDELILLPYSGVQGLMAFMGPVMKDFASVVIFAYMVVAVADIFFQRKDFNKKMMMSKSEIKREYKEMEGSPEIKSKRKQIHQEMMNEGPAQRTKRSSALITNPTHLAIAILYEEELTMLPVILAMGEGILAAEMIAIARNEGIPIMRNVPLAHALIDSANVMEYVPSQLLEAVAEVLRWVADLQEAGESNIEIDMARGDLEMYLEEEDEE
ncbi:MAG: type III secretion system export apparatus subunit SctU [Puniceicoccales bacterium]|jgi:type III secretion protein U|nr:type III secretion system export apparatus subunit SctU [Puniceicoccales bacterium]